MKFYFKKEKSFKLAVVVKKKLGNAVKRNKFKRRIRNLALKYIKKREYLIVIPKNKKSLCCDYKELEGDFELFLKKNNKINF